MFAWREPISGKLIYAMARFSAVAFREEKPQRKTGQGCPVNVKRKRPAPSGPDRR
ncbi:hypothetical protein NUITMVR1_16120 [Raoultella ornithinolytica]|nr:hypothetical protein NUITMVR1_16120 [Raoultella ornithinolytica]